MVNNYFPSFAEICMVLTQHNQEDADEDQDQDKRQLDLLKKRYTV